MPRNIVIAVDAKERTLDALALGHRVADATAAPVVLVTVFAHHPLRDSEDPELVSTRTDARETLMELARAEGLEHAVMQEDLGELGVGEVLVDVDVLDVHVLADGVGCACRALLERVVE